MTDINKLVEIATQAGKLIMRYYDEDYDVLKKLDSSPVTQADIVANEYIIVELQKHFPEIPIVSEEGAKPVQDGKKFFLVDPLDGTKGFIAKSGQFTVNIGLIENKKATVGVIYIPVSGDVYWGGEHGAFKNGKQIKCRKAPEDGLTVVASKSHVHPRILEYIKDLNVKTKIPASSSLKFCLVAEGVADLYPRFGRTMEWDTAAGQAILTAAGGRVETPEGEEFSYAKNDIFENGAFIARGDL